ncbi:hypothetical protein HD806DRAFT_409904 [Xylariaceae sp. AK1471]|nr:hypothetical protein HD806DRAFT_409904 [Xylariaceae sp. AK1471]
MASHFPSIQSFYSTEVPSEGANESSDPTKTGDGFTSSEVEAVMNPLSCPFRPSRNYDVRSIAELQPGPRNYEITGRVVKTSGPHRKPQSERGYYFLVICDSTAAIAVSLSLTKLHLTPRASRLTDDVFRLDCTVG